MPEHGSNPNRGMDFLMNWWVDKGLPERRLTTLQSRGRRIKPRLARLAALPNLNRGVERPIFAWLGAEREAWINEIGALGQWRG